MLAAQRSTGSTGSPEQLELAEWRAVYEEFVRTKQSCGESIDGSEVNGAVVPDAQVALR